MVNDLHYDTISLQARGAVPSRLRRWLGRATEPPFLFPATALVMLAVIWGLTVNLIRVERAAAERAAAVSSHELAETYEAQLVRALGEIDQTLKVVKYAYELRDQTTVLSDLKARTMLPHELLFSVSIADKGGHIVGSTDDSAMTNVVDQDYFQTQLESDTFSVGSPQRDPASGEWKLNFARGLSASDGTFAGVVMLSVDAAYFVSGYEPSTMGQHGVLALVGTDGIFRARRSGDAFTAGDAIDYAEVLRFPDDENTGAPLSTSGWDGVPRYTSVREFYAFPLALIVGLSAEERLTSVRDNRRVYLWRAAASSLLLLLVVGVLWSMSRQLARSRLQAVTEQLAHAARIEYLAYHDGLTKLPNRSMFSMILARSIRRAQRYGRKLSVLFLDLDRFKHINDTLGHEAGDQLLQEVAKRLKECLRESDTVARLGGDEFVVLLPESDEDEYVATVAQKMLSALARPFILLEQEYRVTGSVGISSYPQDGLDEQTLTKNADIAMYRAKEEGKNNVQFYSPSLSASSLQRLTLESALRHALTRGEFQLHYQAKRDMRNGRITGMEALLRWQHPDLGTVAPMQFIPIAEETGLIVPIGLWVLRTACHQNVAWQKLGLPHLSVAVNLTARQFLDERLLADLTTILAETGMEAQLLELEIAESLLMSNVDKALHVLTRLREMGIRIAIDDFGIGYASLSTLKQFPLNTIKIDRSFIRDITTASADEGLALAIIAMGRALSLTVVAQGVETKEQADVLRQNACAEFQGFYLNRPVPAAEMTALLGRQGQIDDSAMLAVLEASL